MKKKTILSILLMLLLLISACSKDDNKNETKENSEETEDIETITYESENGPIEVPADPQRVVVLSTFVGDVLQLDVPVVGADSWSMDNPNFADQLKEAEEVSDESIEKILDLNPDLIIGLSTMKNLDKLSEIAPTVTFTYGELDYLEQHIAIAKTVNKEEEATEWAKDFKKRAANIGEKIKDKIGKNATVSVIENFDKQLYVYGDNWARGTEILYQAMGLNMPDKVKEQVQKEGYYAISTEVVSDFAGDYIVLSHDQEKDKNFLDSDIIKDLPAVKNDQVLDVDLQRFAFNDAKSLEYQLEFFKDYFLDE